MEINPFVAAASAYNRQDRRHANRRMLFSVDLTRIGGPVLKSEEVQKAIAGSNQIVITTYGRYAVVSKMRDVP
jgi:hypothetical protein